MDTLHNFIDSILGIVQKENDIAHQQCIYRIMLTVLIVHSGKGEFGIFFN
jgi:hypothetical protein